MSESLGRDSDEGLVSLMGPAHPLHPQYRGYYTEGGIDRTMPGADTDCLVWEGHGEEGKMVAQPRPVEEGTV